MLEQNLSSVHLDPVVDRKNILPSSHSLLVDSINPSSGSNVHDRDLHRISLAGRDGIHRPSCVEISCLLFYHSTKALILSRTTLDAPAFEGS